MDDDSFIPRRKPPEKPAQQDIRISIPTGPVTAFFKDRATWLIVVAALWGGTDLWTKVKATDAVTDAANAASETKELVKDKAVETKELVEDKTGDISHKLENGLADRIASKVNKNTDEKLKTITQRLDAIEKFLAGDEAAIPKPNTTTLVKPEG